MAEISDWDLHTQSTRTGDEITLKIIHMPTGKTGTATGHASRQASVKDLAMLDLIRHLDASPTTGEN